jgi:tRNA(Ile)-lysidine synthase
MTELVSLVRDTMDRYHMAERGSAVVTGLSGGADSVCLFHILAGLREEMDLTLEAVHVNHGLRETAFRDEDFCRDLCRRFGVPLTVVRAPVRAYAEENRCGLEEAGRILRRQAFEEAAREKDARIALAHHMEDQAETVLFNICRGASLAGISGMKPVNGRVIRPLLFATRPMIEDYLRSEQAAWQTDETNADPAYTRNRIRNTVLPSLETLINPGVISHLSDLAKDAADAESYLEGQTVLAAAACMEEEKGRVRIRIPSLLDLDPFMRRRILYRGLSMAAGRKKDLGQVHVRMLEDLLAGGGSASLSLPGGVKALREYGILTLSRGGEGEAEDGEDYPLDPSEYSFRVLPFDGKMDSIPQMLYTKWLDYDKIRAIPVFRKREKGDRLTISESGASKTAARYMIDCKVPAALRDRIVLPMHGKELLWFPGGRISAAFKVTEATKNVIEITWKGRHK